MRQVLVRQLAIAAFGIAGQIFSSFELLMGGLVVGLWPYGHHVRVEPLGLRVRWLFLRKMVPIDEARRAVYLPPEGILRGQRLVIEVIGKPALEIRGSPS